MLEDDHGQDLHPLPSQRLGYTTQLCKLLPAKSVVSDLSVKLQQ